MSQAFLRASSFASNFSPIAFPLLHTRMLKTSAKTMASKPPFDPSQPIHWVLDWDGTITRHDTLDALVSIAAFSKPDSPVLEEWKRVSEAYMTDYTAALKNLAPDCNLPETIQEDSNLLRALESVEQASLNRVFSSGIFAGLTGRLIEEGARRVITSKKVELRKGFANFLHHTESRSHDDLHILSVNWSRHFISSCLRAVEVYMDREAIHANEFDGIERGLISTGKISPDEDAEMKIISSGDKLEHLARLRKLDCELSGEIICPKKPVVYVGDSWTDIGCLLDSDLGICIRDDPMGSSQKKLAERLQNLDVNCPHLHDWRRADKWQVVWAKDFTEIQSWVVTHSTKRL